jgi:hypothetical protein
MEATAMVAQSLYQNAVSKNNVAAQIFWLKTRGGWRENPKDQDPAKEEAAENVGLSATERARRLAALFDAARTRGAGPSSGDDAAAVVPESGAADGGAEQPG